MASGIFRALKVNLPLGFTRKKRLECIGKVVMMLYLAIKHLRVPHYAKAYITGGVIWTLCDWLTDKPLLLFGIVIP